MTEPFDPHAELASLVAGFRAHLAWRERGGSFAASASPSPRIGVELEPTELDAGPEADLHSPGDDAGADYQPRGGLTLAQVREELGDCTRCKLAEKRNKIVFGVGSDQAPLMFVGEAPGADEDRKGEPFVGRAGQLLDKMIGAMGWTRDTVYIANVLKCRPPGNRDPQPDEVEACEPFLARQIEAIRPRIIVTLGKPAAHLLLRTRAPISALRGRFQSFRDIPVMPTFHPAYLLRSPDKKREAWSDLQQVMAELERLGIPAPNPR